MWTCGKFLYKYIKMCPGIELLHQPTLMHNFLYSLTIYLLHYYPGHVKGIYRLRNR